MCIVQERTFLPAKQSSYHPETMRLYRSPSPGKRRYIENETDIAATRSPICGASVFGKIISGKSNSNSNSSNTPLSGQSNGGKAQPDYVSIHRQQTKKSIITSTGGLSYESIGSSPTFSGGRKSPESTESSTSGASSHGDEDFTGDQEGKESVSYALQFEPKLEEAAKEEADSSDRLKLRMDRLQAWMEQQQKQGSGNGRGQQQAAGTGQSQGFSIKNRAHLWSTNLPVVTEERSFEVEDSSITSGGQSLKEEGEPPKNIRSYSSPERNEMLLAMRQLVLKQQAALSEIAEENRHYRRELQECRKLLTLAKEAYTKQQRQVESFTLEKESSDAEVMWLREEVKTLRAEIQKHQEEANAATWTSSKTAEEVEERLRQARSQTPERKREQGSVAPVEESPIQSPVASPVQSPLSSPSRSWKLKSILPQMSYLTDEADSDEELMKEVEELRTTLVGSGISAKDLEQRLREHQMAESRDDGRPSPKMWQNEESKGSEDEKREWARSRSPLQSKMTQERTEPSLGPDDEMRDWSRSRSPTHTRVSQENERPLGPEDDMDQLERSRSPVPFKQLPQISRGRSLTRSGNVFTRESSHTPSDVSASGSSVSMASSAASQRSKEEVALFKSRLDAIQKKREHRKQIEETVGSRSGRVRFT